MFASDEVIGVVLAGRVEKRGWFRRDERGGGGYTHERDAHGAACDNCVGWKDELSRACGGFSVDEVAADGLEAGVGDVGEHGCHTVVELMVAERGGLFMMSITLRPESKPPKAVP